MSARNTLTEAANACGEASATLARFRALLAGAANLDAPAVAHATVELRRLATQLEVTAIALANATRPGTAA